MEPSHSDLTACCDWSHLLSHRVCLLESLVESYTVPQDYQNFLYTLHAPYSSPSWSPLCTRSVYWEPRLLGNHMLGLMDGSVLLSPASIPWSTRDTFRALSAVYALTWSSNFAQYSCIQTSCRYTRLYAFDLQIIEQICLLARRFSNTFINSSGITLTLRLFND